MPLQARLDLSTHLQDMPEITSGLTLRLDYPKRLEHGQPSISDGLVPAQAFVVGQPEQQCPGFSIDWQGTFGYPDRVRSSIDNIEIGATTLATIDFVQSQRARAGRGQFGHIFERTLLSLLNHTGNRSQRDFLPGQAPQTSLNATVRGMTLQ